MTDHVAACRALARAARWEFLAADEDELLGLGYFLPREDLPDVRVPGPRSSLHAKLAFLGDVAHLLDARIYIVSEFPGGLWRVRLERADHISADDHVRELVHATLLAALAIATDVPIRRTP